MFPFDLTGLLGGAQGYTEEQRRRANNAGILGAASALANAAAPRYGQPSPTLLQGVLGGVQGYQSAGTDYLSDVARFYEPTRTMQQNAQQEQYIRDNPNLGQRLGTPEGYPVTPELLNSVVPRNVAAKTAFDLSQYYEPRIAAARAQATFPYEQSLADNRAANQLQNNLALVQAREAARGGSQRDDRTAVQKNYEFYLSQGIPEDRALSMATNLFNKGRQFNEAGDVVNVPNFNAGKPLNYATTRDLAAGTENVQILKGLGNSFSDDYGGNVLETYGNIENWIGRTFDSGFTEQANWWQQYQRFKNVDRNKLFGGALTPGEIQQFDRASVHPGMSPAIIKKNIAYQAGLVEKALQRKALATSKSGYDNEAINAATDNIFSDVLQRQGGGVSDTRAQPNDPGIAVEGGGAGNAGDSIPTVNSPEEAARLPSGTTFRTPDGRLKRVR